MICVQNCEENFGLQTFLDDQCGQPSFEFEIIEILYNLEAATAPLGSNPMIIRDNWEQNPRVVESLDGFYNWNCISLPDTWSDLIDGNNFCYWSTMTIIFTDQNGNQRTCEYQEEFCVIIG